MFEPARELWDRVARYLLLALVFGLAVDAVVGVPAFPFSRLTVVVAAAFAALACLRARAGVPFAPGPSRSLDDACGRYGRGFAVVLLGLLVLGGALRGYGLGVQSFWFDEAITANAAIALLETGRPTFPSGVTYWRGAPHTLAVAGSMALFGTGEAAARLPSVVFGVATVAVTYRLGTDVDGRAVGLVSAALLTFATWEIAWSRQARMYQLFQLLFALSLVLLLRAERADLADRRTLTASGTVVALAAATHQIGAALLPVGAAFLGLAGIRDGRVSRSTAGAVVVGSLGLAIALELATGGVAGVVERLTTEDVSYWGAYADWLADELHAFFLLGPVGAALTLYRGRYRAGALLALAVVPATWALSFRVELFATRYLYFALPVLFVWAAVAVVTVADAVVGAGAVDAALSAFRARFDDEGALRASASLALSLALVTVLAQGGGFTAGPRAEYDLGANAPQPDFASAYEYVNDHRQPGDVVVAGWTAPGLYYAGGVDYWLAHDLTGRGTNWTVNGVDRYAGAEPIRTPSDLEGVVATHDRGWIVADAPLSRRWSEFQRVESADLHRALVLDDGDELRVYSWNRTDAHEAASATDPQVNRSFRDESVSETQSFRAPRAPLSGSPIE